MSNKKIGIVGLGRLGLCLALNLEKVGYEVYGYDISEDRMNSIKNKSLKTTEPLVLDLLEKQKYLFLENNCQNLLKKCDVVFVVIATPSKPDGKYNHNYIDNFIENEILRYNNTETKYLIINSTVMPGYTDSVSNRISKLNWKVCYNPEFIAQGSIIVDQKNPDLVLIGSEDFESSNVVENIYKNMCENTPSFCKMSNIEAEICKISLNCFLTTKISFANMIGDICLKAKANPDVVLSAISKDTRIGNKYLKYGFGFGGECLPRDNRALAIFSRENGIEPTISVATDEYNKLHLSYQVENFVKNSSSKEVILEDGVSFKKGNDIITESQQLEYAKMLRELGYKVIIIEKEEVIEKVSKMLPGYFQYKVKK